MPTDGEYVYPGLIPENGFWHFTIDKDYLDLEVQGDPQTPTGWNYSFVAPMNDSWSWNDPGGNSLWQTTFPSLTLSSTDDDVMYVVASKVSEGAENDPDGDPCTVDSEYAEWSMDNYVIKSIDGGATWWCPWNTTDSHWGDVNGDGILNILDIISAINIILNDTYNIIADLNDDNSVDVLDIILMTNILIGNLPE